MLDLALERRRSSGRPRSTVTQWVGRLEALEPRVVLNGAVGVPARFSPPPHNFQVTSIPEDPDNDGRVATQSVTIIGFAERPGLGDFTDTHLAITIEALPG